MAQTGYTPILIYSSSTTSNVPTAGNLTNSTLGSELAINITDGKLFYKDNGGSVQVIGWKVVPTSAGGTGLTSYTAGDMLYYASGTTLSKLAIGTSGQWLGSSGTAPQWNSPAALTKTDDTNVTLTLGGSASTALLNAASLTLGWTGQLAVTRGGTGLSSVAQGDILYGSAANTLSALAKNTTATRYLSNTGSSNNPAWAQIDLTNGVTGTLPTGNGGTGLTSFTSTGVMYATSTSALSTAGGLKQDGTNASLGTASSAWNTFNAFEVGSAGVGLYGYIGYSSVGISLNAYYNSGWKYGQTGRKAGIFDIDGDGNLTYQNTTTTGSAGGAITTFTTKFQIANSGDVTFNVGNLIQGAAAKGINFTANTAAAGMTSQLLNWYEEGDFTPTLTRDTVAPTLTYTAQVGKYVRVGRQVTLNGSIFFTVTASGSGLILIGGFPFTANSTSSYSASGSVGYCDSLSTGADAIYMGQNGTGCVVTVNGGFAGGTLSSGRIYFTITYQV